MDEKPPLASPHDQAVVRKKTSWFMLKLLVSLGLLGLILFFIDFRQVLGIIAGANPWYLLAVVVLVYLDRLLMAYKWDQLLRAVAVRVPFFVLFRTYAIAPVANILLPSTIGGDIFRLYSLSRYKADTKAVLASMVVERVIAFGAVLVLAGASLVLMAAALGDGLLHGVGLSTGIIVGAGIVVGLVGTIHPESRRYADKFAARFAAYPLVGKVHQIYLLCSEYRRHWRTVAAVSAWTLLEQTVPTLGNALIVCALHINVSLLDVMAITLLTLLITRLPITIDSLGIKEGVYVAFFGWIGVSASEAFLISMVGRVIPLIALLPWGLHYIFRGR